MKKMLALGILVGAFLVVGAAPAMAQTSDGLTPAVETLCDNLEGNLFGMCNAYCEAMDCHLKDQNASDVACDKLLTKFMAAIGEVPPCLNCLTVCVADRQVELLKCLVEAGTDLKAQLRCDEAFKGQVRDCVRNCSKGCLKECKLSFDAKLMPAEYLTCVKACQPDANPCDSRNNPVCIAAPCDDQKAGTVNDQCAMHEKYGCVCTGIPIEEACKKDLNPVCQVLPCDDGSPKTMDDSCVFDNKGNCGCLGTENPCYQGGTCEPKECNDKNAGTILDRCVGDHVGGCFCEGTDPACGDKLNPKCEVAACDDGQANTFADMCRPSKDGVCRCVGVDPLQQCSFVYGSPKQEECVRECQGRCKNSAQPYSGVEFNAPNCCCQCVQKI